MAEDSYTQAITLAAAAEQLEEMVKARWGLGVVYDRTGRVEQARQVLARPSRERWR